jgi:DEAD/H associated
MGRKSFTQELKGLAQKAGEGMDAGGCWREVIFLHRERHENALGRAAWMVRYGQRGKWRGVLRDAAAETLREARRAASVYDDVRLREAAACYVRLAAAVFPSLAACQDNAPAGPIEIPDHPLVRETLGDCLGEAMDIEGLRALVRRFEQRAVRVHFIDTVEPSVLAHEILKAPRSPTSTRTPRSASAARGRFRCGEACRWSRTSWVGSTRTPSRAYAPRRDPSCAIATSFMTRCCRSSPAGRDRNGPVFFGFWPARDDASRFTLSAPRTHSGALPSGVANWRRCSPLRALALITGFLRHWLASTPMVWTPTVPRRQSSRVISRPQARSRSRTSRS